jgi:hypothetical protein
MGQVKFFEVCGNEVKLKLFPEFSSSGLWCYHCGVNYADPCESFPDIPKGLASLIEGWTWLWDVLDNDNFISGYSKELLTYMGMELSGQLNNFYPNVFNSDWIDRKNR